MNIRVRTRHGLVDRRRSRRGGLQDHRVQWHSRKNVHVEIKQAVPVNILAESQGLVQQVLVVH